MLLKCLEVGQTIGIIIQKRFSESRTHHDVYKIPHLGYQSYGERINKIKALTIHKNCTVIDTLCICPIITHQPRAGQGGCACACACACRLLVQHSPHTTLLPVGVLVYSIVGIWGCLFTLRKFIFLMVVKLLNVCAVATSPSDVVLSECV